MGQGLAGPRPASLVAVTERLGRVQMDPAVVVARAEQLTYWSRLGAFDLGELRRLREEEPRRIFEYLGFLLPVADLPLHRPVMRRYPRPIYERGNYVAGWLRDNAPFRAYILDEVRARGPLRSRDLDDRAVVPWRTGGWNDGKNLSRMLEILWSAGDLTVARREGNERFWDLFERVLPAEDEEELPDEVVAIEGMDRQLRAAGLLPPSFGTALDYALPAREVGLESLLADAVAIPISVDGLPGEWLAHRDGLAELDAGAWRPRTTLLGPFDPLVADRERALALFGMAIKLEMYKPAAKREWGAYVLPILDGDELIGRVDPRFDRRRATLVINAVYAQPGAPGDAWPAVHAALDDLAAWLGAASVELPELPADWR